LAGDEAGPREQQLDLDGEGGVVTGVLERLPTQCRRRCEVVHQLPHAGKAEEHLGACNA
jgi:hypothetical protein